MKEKVLTNEVFQRDDCPKWAKWAAVDSDGTAYWYEEKPTQGRGVFWAQEDPATKFVRINEKFSRTVDLIERKQSQTNLEWLCEHPKELAKKLIHFDARIGKWLAPDGTAVDCDDFDFYDAETNSFSIDQVEEGCLLYTIKWLKQEHKENKHDTKQS